MVNKDSQCSNEYVTALTAFWLDKSSLMILTSPVVFLQ